MASSEGGSTDFGTDESMGGDESPREDTDTQSQTENTDLPPDAVAHNRSGSMIERRQRRRSSFGSGNVEVLDNMLRKYSHNKNSIDLTGGMGDQLLNDPTYAEETADEQPQLVNEFDEMADLQNEREQLGKLFEQIDINTNGDVDVDEFVRGVQAIGIELNQVDIRKLFHLIDIDGSNFVDSDEFVLFCQRRAHNPETTRLQSAVIEKANLGDDRRGSNLMRETDDWDNMDMIHVQREMEKQMQEMLTTEVQIVQQEQSFFNEIEDREQDDGFCDPGRAEDWDKFEVAAWIKNMGPGFELYAKYFFQEEVDGVTLLNDITDAVLQYDLSVKIIHIPRVLRNIDNLRHKMRSEMKVPYDVVPTVYEITYIPAERAVDRIKELEEELAARDAMIDDMKRAHAEEINGYNLQLERALQRYDEYQTKGYVSDSDDEDAAVMIRARSEMEAAEDGDEDNQPDVDVAVVSDARSIPSSHHSATQSVMSLSAHAMTAIGSMADIDGKTGKNIKRLQHRIELAKQEDPDFALDSRAREWLPQEVASWLADLDFPEYGLQFLNSKVSGEILVSDVTNEILTDDLGVRKVHSKVILRAIDKLKTRLPDAFTISDFNHIGFEPVEDRPTQETIDTLQARMEELTSERDEIMKELEQQQQSTENNDGDENEDDEAGAGGGYFSTKIAELETERDELREQLNDAMTSAKDELEEALTLSTEKITELETTITSLQEEISQKDVNLEELQTEMDKRKHVDTMAPLNEHLNVILAECIELADSDPEFADKTNVVHWTSKEVLYWLHTIAFDSYIEAFADAAVDGQILVADINVDRLVDDLGVKGMHTAKFVREIQSLKNSSVEKELPDTLPDLKEIEKLEKELAEERKNKDNILREAEALQSEVEQLSSALHVRQAQEGGGSADVDGEEGTNLDPETQERIAMLESKLEYIEDDKMNTMVALGEEVSTLRSIILALSNDSSYWERAYHEASKSPLEQVAEMFLKPSGGSGARRGRRYR